MPLDPYYSEKKLFCNVGKEIKEKLDSATVEESRNLYEIIDDALRAYFIKKGKVLKTTPKRLELAKQYNA